MVEQSRIGKQYRLHSDGKQARGGWEPVYQCNHGSESDRWHYIISLYERG